MNSINAYRVAPGLLLCLLTGCISPPQDYRPGYSYVATGFGTAKGINGSVLAPDACLGQPADTVPEPAATDVTVVPALGPHLPPGCANAYNLQRMVESRRDLVEGRRMGPASSAPTVRAARRYLEGQESTAAGDTGGSATTSPQPSIRTQ